MTDRKEYLKEYRKKWYEENKEEQKIKSKEYYKEHKEDLNNYNKQYRLNNPNKWKEEYNIKIVCNVCGLTTSKSNIARHQRTNKCKKYVDIRF